MKVYEFVNLGNGTLIEVYDCKGKLVYSDFVDDQESWFEQIEDEEIHYFQLNSDRINIYLKNYEKTTYIIYR